MKVYLDGNLVQVPSDSLMNPKFIIRREDEEGKKVISFTGDITFTGADAAYIKNKLILAANAQADFVVLKFVDDCCDTPVEFQFKILPESLEWCNDNCDIKAAAVEYTTTSEQYACLKNTMIYDNYNGFQSQNHPKMTYCIELRPSSLQDFVIICAILLNIILAALWPAVFVIALIVSTINLVIGVVNDLGGDLDEIDFDGDSSTNTLEEYENFLDKLNSHIIGCGRKHPSPLVRSYAENVCGKCGLTFQSQIFNQPSGGPYGGKYYNTVYFNAPVKKGQEYTDNSNWRDENKPLLNGTLYFDQLKEHFNAKWRIINNVLIFERRDWFATNNVWIDLTTYDESKIQSICYNWSKKQRFSYANLQYSKDAIDWVGNEALDRYNDIVEWNNPYSTTQKGERLWMSAFTSSRHRDDGIERDVLSDYKNAPFFGTLIQQYENVMLMNNGTSFNPKLMIWDPATGYTNSKVDPTCCANGVGGVSLNQHYNYPLWFNEGYSGNMYDNFWAIENPRNALFPLYEFKAEIVWDCLTLDGMDIDGGILTAYGYAKEIFSIELDYKTKIMTITGTV
jgi:hypothetical protein